MTISDELWAPCRLVVRNPSFDQVSMAVQLMLDLQVCPAHTWKVDLVVGKDVAIGCLTAPQQGD